MADSFTVTRVFQAPPERVFSAFTEPEQFARWWGTESVEVPVDSVSIDAREGGRWAAQMRVPMDEGEELMIIDWSGEYTEVDPPRRLAYTLKDDPGREAGAPVVVDFEELPEGAGTRVILTQTSPDFTPEQTQATVAGYSDFFDALAGVLGVD